MGGPINAWAGSEVEEVTSTNHVVTFNEIDSPKTITVVFTLKNVEFINEFQALINDNIFNGWLF